MQRIAPAPPRTGSDLSDGNAPQSCMTRSCQTCARRKVKCDKLAPSCSRCRKGGLECLYRDLPPSSWKGFHISNVLERLSQCEDILRRNGLLEKDVKASRESFRGSPAVGSTKSGPSKTGKLLVSQGKSRYIDSHSWYDLPGGALQHISDDEEADVTAPFDASVFKVPASDPLTGTLLGLGQDILQSHPPPAHAMMMWNAYAENVDPVCKILHIPSTARAVESVSRHPQAASRTDECLLFAIYHSAVLSMTDEDCVNQFAQNRSTLLQRYHLAARQALVNASFLKTTELPVLQALYLFLLSSRYSYDPHTYWILTGVAARIGQRIGLHRDGERLGLPPFEVEMRRRLFCQIFPLDARAGQFAGTDFMGLPSSWDTRPPLNINDDQIWPGMTVYPVEQIGATDMIFCLSRAYVGEILKKAGDPINGAAPWKFSDYLEAETFIKAAENEVEEKFIRYCDIGSPLHFLTIALARSGMAALRLKIRLPEIRDQNAPDTKRKEAFLLAQKTLDIDAAVNANQGANRYQWLIRPFFLWGTRDSFVLTLTILLKRADLLSTDEVKAAWKRIAQFYQNHDELFDGMQPFDVALRRLALKAWDACESSGSDPEPSFISTLRYLQEKREKRHLQLRGSLAAAPMNHFDTFCGTSCAGIDSDVDVDDWTFWDQFIQENQS